MARPAINWLITDTHFNHDYMIQCGRPPDYQRQIISNCRSLIAEQDTLYHLGDVIFGMSTLLPAILENIKGRKILIRGNHDRKTNGWYERNGFHYVADSIQLGKIVLSHKPMCSLPDGAEINIHGHWHGNNHRVDESAGWYDRRRHLKLAVEETGYKPVIMQQWVDRQLAKVPADGNDRHRNSC